MDMASTIVDLSLSHRHRAIIANSPCLVYIIKPIRTTTITTQTSTTTPSITLAVQSELCALLMTILI